MRTPLNTAVDIVSTYPNLQSALNIDKETTQTELSSVEGFHEQEWRHAGIDLTAGYVNATMVSQKLFGLPEVDEMLEAFLEDNPEYLANLDKPADETMEAEA